MKYWLH